MEKDYYLHVGKAADLKNPKKRKIYRAFEVLPGALSVGILFFCGGDRFIVFGKF